MIPIRVWICILGAYACSLVFMNRSAMSVVIVVMTKQPNTSSNNQNHRLRMMETSQHRMECFSSSRKIENRTILPRTQSNNNSFVIRKAEFQWDEKLQGIIMGSQFYLYLIVPIVSGRLTDAIGGRWIAMVGVLGPCLLSASTPILTRQFGSTALIVNRILTGAFHGCIYPAIFSLFIKWFPIEERSIANGCMVFGASMGSALMYALSGVLSEKTDIGWPLVFYVLSAFHLPFLILWLLLATNEPDHNRWLSSNERQFILANRQEKVSSRKIQAPWVLMFLSTAVLSSFITKMCSGFSYFLLITKMPSYLSKIFGIDLVANGTFNAVSNLAGGLSSLLAPKLANIFIERFKWRRLIVRKIFQSVAMFGPAICLGLIPSMECHSSVVIVLLIMSMFLYGFYTAGEWTIVSEFSPNFAGTVFGFTNSSAVLMGIIGPYIVGVMLDANQTASRHQWNIVFYLMMSIFIFGAITFIIFGTDKQQVWDLEIVNQFKKLGENQNNKESQLKSIQLKPNSKIEEQVVIE